MTIKREDGKYVVYSRDLSRRFGEYDSRAAAEERLRQIERFSKVKALKVGDFVSWSTRGSTANGRITRVVRDGTLKVPGVDFSLKGDKDNPAALIRLYRDGKATDQMVGHKFSSLNLTRPLDKMQPTMSQVHVPTTSRRRKKDLLKQDSYTPPSSVARNAARAQQWIKEGKHGKGFTDVGRARAGQLANRNPVSIDTIKRMVGYFTRHQKDKDASGFRLGEKDYPTPGRVAWDAWGGNDGQSWARGVLSRYEAKQRRMEKQECPPATQDVSLNLKNRKTAIEEANYGPLDPNLPNDLYWQERAEVFDTTPENARNSRCGNCAAFDVTDSTKACIASGITKVEPDYRYDGSEPKGAATPLLKQDPYDVIDAGELGYCRVFKFKCAAARTCDAWLVGGPIDDEEEDADKQETQEIDAGNVKIEININKALARFNGQEILKKEQERRYTLGPLYIPNKIDAHGEYTDGNELQKAVWNYVKKGDRRIRLQHNRDVVAGEWVEVMTWPYEMTVEMQMANGEVKKTKYPADTVFMGVVWKDWAWDLVKAGKVRGYSIGGKAERVDVDVDD